MHNNAHCSPDHYNSETYYETVRIERGYTNGLTPEEVYKREADFALRASGLTSPDMFGENTGVLDVACGAGYHAFVMSDMLNREVPIHACDPAGELGELAKAKLLARERQGIHDRITFTFGKQAMMQQLSRNSLGESRYRLITVLGDSFDMNVHDTQQALMNLCNILEPGGKVVLQFRQRDPQVSTQQQENQQQRIEARRRELGIVAEPYSDDGGSQSAMILRDTRNGGAFFRRYIDCDGCPDPQRTEEYQVGRSEAGEKIWVHNSGIQYKTIERAYFAPSAEPHKFPHVMINSFLREESLPTSRRMFEDAGFENVELKTPENEDEYLGGHRIMAYVASKPV